MLSLLLVGIGGALGSMLRFLLSSFMAKYFCTSFPCGTLIVNLLGSYLITFLMEIFITSAVDPLYRYLLIIGFLGGFTTLSSVTYDTLTLFRNGESLLAFLNLFFNALLTLCAGFLGYITARLLLFKGL